MVCPAHLVCLASRERRVCLGQRETQVSPEAPDLLEETDMMEALDSKESLVCLVSLELAAHPDPPPRGRSESQAPLEHLDQWDHQDTLEPTEPRATPVPLAWTSRVRLETEDHLASMELPDPQEPQDLLEDQGGMAHLVCQDLKETWAQSDPLDQVEAPEDLEVLVAPDLKVNLGFQVETVLQELRDLKEREETLVFKDLQD